MLVYCIRHGESTLNAEGRIQGHLDVPLSLLGQRQSTAVAAAVAPLPIEAVFSSPLKRARETADPIAAALGLEVQIEPRLIEINAGIFQGKRRDELDALYPEVRRHWKNGEPDFAIPGGESRRDLMRRGGEVLRALAKLPYAKIIVVSHGGILAGALKSLLEVPAQRNPFLLENASITQVEITAEEIWLHSLNQVAHLGEMGLAGSGDL